MNRAKIIRAFLDWLSSRPEAYQLVVLDKYGEAAECMDLGDAIEAFLTDSTDEDDWKSGVPPLGTDIVLMWGPHENNPIIARRREGRWWRSQYGDWLSDWESNWRWMPLPVPPEKKG